MSTVVDLILSNYDPEQKYKTKQRKSLILLELSPACSKRGKAECGVDKLPGARRLYWL